MELCKQWGIEQQVFMELKIWFRNQKHLPQNTPDEYFVMIIHSCYSDIQNSIKTMDAYFRQKSSSPQLLTGRSVHSQAIQQAKDVAPAVILPKLTEDGCVVIWTWMADNTVSAFSLDDILKLDCMIYDVVILENPACPGIIFVNDQSGFSFKHIFRISLSTSQKYLEYIQKASPIRLKGIHILNVGAAMPRLLNIVRPFIHKEYSDVFNLYASKDFEVMLKKTKITLDMVPKEFGGQGPSRQNMLDDTMKQLASYEDWFKFDETLQVMK